MAINLSIAQIDLSMSEGGYSVDTLVDSFTYMQQNLEQMRDQMLRDDQDDAVLEVVRNKLSCESELLTHKVVESIIAFQFYDKLSQRLNHVSHGLSALIDLISDVEDAHDPDAWQRFVAQVERYSAMPEEQQLFDLIFRQGIKADDAIALMKERIQKMIADEQAQHAANRLADIELF
jgi:hypothetical protein